MSHEFYPRYFGAREVSKRSNKNNPPPKLPPGYTPQGEKRSRSSHLPGWLRVFFFDPPGLSYALADSTEHQSSVPSSVWTLRKVPSTNDGAAAVLGRGAEKTINRLIWVLPRIRSFFVCCIFILTGREATVKTLQKLAINHHPKV